MGVCDVASAYPGFMNVVSNGPQISIYNFVYGSDLTERGLKQMLRPKLKSVALMKDLAWKLSKPGDFGVGRVCGALLQREGTRSWTSIENF